MKKLLLMLMLLQGIAMIGYGQNKKKPSQPKEDTSAFSLLSPAQKGKVKEINQQYVAEMKVLLAQPSSNPMERREKMLRLRTSRDSTLKAALGEQTFNDYQKKATIKRRQ